MSDADTNRAGLDLETGEDVRPSKKIWRAPKIARLDGRSALTGTLGAHSDTTSTDAAMS